MTDKTNFREGLGESLATERRIYKLLSRRIEQRSKRWRGWPHLWIFYVLVAASHASVANWVYASFNVFVCLFCFVIARIPTMDYDAALAKSEKRESDLLRALDRLDDWEDTHSRMTQMQQQGRMRKAFGGDDGAFEGAKLAWQSLQELRAFGERWGQHDSLVAEMETLRRSWAVDGLDLEDFGDEQ